MPLSSERARAAISRLQRLGVREEDLEETFIHSGGKGGQNVNKVATCVALVHRPSGLAVKCQAHRTQGRNRVLARELLADKLEERQTRQRAAAIDEAARRRRQTRPRPRGVKKAILVEKRQVSRTKALRRRPSGRPDDDG
jgi:protein subunit release factor B